MDRPRIQIYLDQEDYDQFIEVAKKRGQKPATLAAHILTREYPKYEETADNN